MSADLVDESMVSLVIISGYLFALSVGCLIADFVFPHIPFIERFLNTLPDWEDED